MQDSSSNSKEPSAGGHQNNPFQLDLNSVRSKKEAPDQEVQPRHESQPSPVSEEDSSDVIEVSFDDVIPVSLDDIAPPQVSKAFQQAKNMEKELPAPRKERNYPKAEPDFSDNENDEESHREKSVPTVTFRLFLICVVLGATLVTAYWHTLVDLVNTWYEVTDYHHGFFVIPLVIYFLWSRRSSIPQNISATDRVAGVVLGFILLGLCVLGRHQFMVFSMASLDAWTMLLWIFGVTLIFFGFRTFLWAAPSLLFLAFMFPWPDSIEVLFRRHLQGIAAKLSALILWGIGEHAISINNTIWLDSIQLDVAAACSGIRILVSVIAAAYAVSLLMRRPWWQNAFLFCLAIPVALLVNALRIVTTGLLIKYASATVESWGFDKPVGVVCDEIAGNVMLLLAFLTFILIVYYIGKVFERVEPEENEA